jgi:hypothetical protein
MAGSIQKRPYPKIGGTKRSSLRVPIKDLSKLPLLAEVEREAKVTSAHLPCWQSIVMDHWWFATSAVNKEQKNKGLLH